MRKRKPLSVWLIVFLLFFLAGGGFMGGWNFLSDPSGRSMGFPAELIESIPFIHNYWWPGLFLFTIFGLLPAITGWAIIFRTKKVPPGSVSGKKRHWTWHIVQWIGLILIIWIIAQITIIGLQHPIQISTGVLGLIFWLLGRKKSVRNYFARNSRPIKESTGQSSNN